MFSKSQPNPQQHFSTGSPSARPQKRYEASYRSGQAKRPRKVWPSIQKRSFIMFTAVMLVVVLLVLYYYKNSGLGEDHDWLKNIFNFTAHDQDFAKDKSQTSSDSTSDKAESSGENFFSNFQLNLQPEEIAKIFAEVKKLDGDEDFQKILNKAKTLSEEYSLEEASEKLKAFVDQEGLEESFDKVQSAIKSSLLHFIQEKLSQEQADSSAAKQTKSTEDSSAKSSKDNATTDAPASAGTEDNSNEKTGDKVPDTEEAPEEVSRIPVYISGAVKKAGVYKLPEDSIIMDLVEAAGGLLDEDDMPPINLAAKLTSNSHIHIPSAEEIREGWQPAPQDSAGKEQPEEKAEKPAAPVSEDFPQEDAAKAAEDKQQLSQQKADIEKLDLNSCSKEELTEISGIGPAIADRIILYREKLNRDMQKQDLLQVKGIGNKKYKQIQKFFK